MPSANSLKSFLHAHSHALDFVGASLIIVICFVVLLPKVHQSFLPNHQTQPLSPHQEEPDGHAHHHTLPVGEVLVCAGFFAFYCIGLGLSQPDRDQRNALYLQERRVSTTCCSSTRCPTSQREIMGELDHDDDLDDNSHDNGARSPNNSHQHDHLDQSPLFADRDADADCVMLLNKHHNHHTHSHHHEHQTHTRAASPPAKRRDYGATLDVGKSSTVYVEEIRITGKRQDVAACLSWPLSAKVTLFGLILAAALTLFDIQGLIQTIKVFRAAATGALLYVAFFLVMPKSSAGCNSCKEEEQV